MQTLKFGLGAVAAVVLAACTTTTVTRRGPQPDMTEGAARIVNADDLREEEGVLSKSAEPERPDAAAPAPAPGKWSRKPHNPSAREPDEEAAWAQEMQDPLFEPKRTVEEVDPRAVEKLLAQMKPKTEQTDKARAKKMGELTQEVRRAAEENAAQADKKFEEAEKLYLQKKYKEATAAYLTVLDLVPTHEGALRRIRQLNADMEEAGKQAGTRKPLLTTRQMLLLEQKFAAAVRLYEDGDRDEAFAKFKEVVEMVQWSPTEIDTKSRLRKAREYIERIKIEKELAGEPRKKAPAEKKEPSQGIEKKPETPGQSKGKEPGPGEVSTD